MADVGKKTRQVGIAPKLVADTLTTIVMFVLLHYLGEVDDDTSAAISKVIGFAVGFVIRPGRVVVEPGR